MSIDLNDPKVQEAIAAAVQAQLASAGVQTPEKPKVLTATEQAEAAIDAVEHSVNRDGSRVADHLHTIVAALRALLAAHKDGQSPTTSADTSASN